VDVVVAVRVAVCAEVSLMVTELEERLHVVGLTALEGELVTAHESATVPVNELEGVTVMVAVLLLVPAGAVTMVPLLLRAKLVVPVVGDCQKFPQPARSGVAASNNRAHFPILIAAPPTIS
jgi:hypothetical protein